MKRKTCKMRTLAVMLAVFSSVSAMGQGQNSGDIDWTKDFTSRITLNGYAQGGWSYQNPNGKATNAYNLKRTLLWAKARITDRWSFMFMHVSLIVGRLCSCTTSLVWYRSFTPTTE